MRSSVLGAADLMSPMTVAGVGVADTEGVVGEDGVEPDTGWSREVN